jgi:hypothetical protein
LIYGHRVVAVYTPALLSILGQHGRLCDGLSLAVEVVEFRRGLPFGSTLSVNSYVAIARDDSLRRFKQIATVPGENRRQMSELRRD